MRKRLIIYAKRPFPGYAKTRLGSSLGIEASAGIYARLLYSYLFDLLHDTELSHCIELSVTSENDVSYFKLAFPEFTVRPQVEGDLGFRMESSFQRAFKEGVECAVLTGSDIPGLTNQLIHQAFKILEHHPVAIGPAADGGYYLIGQRVPGIKLLDGITWSTNTVLEQTKALATRLGHSLVYLPTLADMDEKTDYQQWKTHLKKKLI
jgi:rSAM/selenodomain-associated transferase 1